MKTPYVGFSHDTLDEPRRAKEGDMVFCSLCGGRHALECCADEKEEKTDFLMVYKCGERIMLGALAGRLVANVRPDISGKL